MDFGVHNLLTITNYIDNNSINIISARPGWPKVRDYVFVASVCEQLISVTAEPISVKLYMFSPGRPRKIFNPKSSCYSATMRQN